MSPDSPKIQSAVRNYTKERDDVCVPIVRKIIGILASKPDLLIGSQESGVNEEAVVEYYSNIYVKEIAPLLIEENVRVDYIKYIFTLARSAIDFMADRTEMTIERHYNNATAFRWGVKDTEEITLQMLQDTLTKGIPAEKEETEPVDPASLPAGKNDEASSGVDKETLSSEEK